MMRCYLKVLYHLVVVCRDRHNLVMVELWCEQIVAICGQMVHARHFVDLIGDHIGCRISRSQLAIYLLMQLPRSPFNMSFFGV